MWDLNSLLRDRTHTLCIGRQILNHWTTQKSLAQVFLVTQVGSWSHP